MTRGFLSEGSGPELSDPESGEILAPAEDSVTVAFAIYQQEAARQKHWRSHRFLIRPLIRKAIKARLAEGGGIRILARGFGNCLAQRLFFRAISPRQASPGFRMDLNFFTRGPRATRKILSGFYTREPEPKPPRLPHPDNRLLQPPHRKPAQPFVPEHPDIRDAAAIISWRKIGRFDKANEVETRMAARQNRPPVHVPAPEVARQETLRLNRAARPRKSDPGGRSGSGTWCRESSSYYCAARCAAARIATVLSRLFPVLSRVTCRLFRRACDALS